MSPTLSAAVTGYVETTDRSSAEKNRLLPPNPYSDTPFDFLRAVIMGLHAEMQWAAEPDVQAWLDSSRLNVVKDLAATDDAARLGDLQGRFLSAVFPALERLRAFRATASPAEQALMFDPRRLTREVATGSRRIPPRLRRRSATARWRDRRPRP